MIIGVIGYGVVGSATAEVLKRLGQTVAVWDTDPYRMDTARAEGFSCLNHELTPDVLFICVPEGNVRKALASAPYSPITVIRSTVIPGTTERLSEEFGRPLVFIPETLREATATWDALNPAFILIGCKDEEQGKILTQLFAPLMAPIAIVSPSTAEMVKLTLNAYLHTLISFWNEVQLICELSGIQSHLVGKLCSQDSRVSSYGATMHGKPAAGSCLPKDLLQLIAFAEEKGHVPDLLKAAKRVNHKLMRRLDEPEKESQRLRGSPRLQAVR